MFLRDRDSSPERPENGVMSSEAPELTPEQQQNIVQHWHRAEMMARIVAKQWRINSGDYEFEELVGDANLGLVKAAINYDPNKRREGAKTDGEFFSRSIRGEILKGLRDRYGREHLYVEDESGKKIEAGDVIRKLKPSVMAGVDTAASLNMPVAEDNDTDLVENLADPNSAGLAVNTIFVKDELKRMLKGRSPVDREIFLRRVLLDQTQTDIATAVGVSQMQVSRVISKIEDGRYGSRKPVNKIDEQ